MQFQLYILLYFLLILLTNAFFVVNISSWVPKCCWNSYKLLGPSSASKLLLGIRGQSPLHPRGIGLSCHMVSSSSNQAQCLKPLSCFKSLWHSLLPAFYIFIWLCPVFVVACGVWFPDQGSNLGPLHWERGLSHWTTREVLKTPCF